MMPCFENGSVVADSCLHPLSVWQKLKTIPKENNESLINKYANFMDLKLQKTDNICEFLICEARNVMPNSQLPLKNFIGVRVS